MEEQVFAVPRGELFPSGEAVPEGFRPGGGSPYLERLAVRGGFVQRERAENDPGLKQIIPYGIVTCDEQVFLMRRRRAGGEERLHHLWSLGVGGHINPRDRPESERGRAGADSTGFLARAFHRELEEELDIPGPITPEFVGVLNDDSNPVGQVHFGLVYRVRLTTPRVQVREIEQLDGRFLPVGRLGQYVDSMESWSCRLVEHYWPGVSPGTDSSRRFFD